MKKPTASKNVTMLELSQVQPLKISSSCKLNVPLNTDLTKTSGIWYICKTTLPGGGRNSGRQFSPQCVFLICSVFFQGISTCCIYNIKSNKAPTSSPGVAWCQKYKQEPRVVAISSSSSRLRQIYIIYSSINSSTSICFCVWHKCSIIPFSGKDKGLNQWSSRKQPAHHKVCSCSGTIYKLILSTCIWDNKTSNWNDFVITAVEL